MKSILLMAAFPLALAAAAQARRRRPPRRRPIPLPQAYSAYSQPDVTSVTPPGRWSATAPFRR